MKISKVIKKLQKLKREIGGDPKVYTGNSAMPLENRPLADDDFSVLIMQRIKSGKCSYHVGIKSNNPNEKTES
jgi:hypothetical protein